jgi:hypothetical protein
VTSTAPAAKEHTAVTALDQAPAHPVRVRWIDTLHRPYARDLGICLLFLVFATWVTGGLWGDPTQRALALNVDDQALYEWFIAYDARVLFGDFHLVTSRLNAPDGVNLLANTSIIAIGAVLSPITVAFGAPVTFAVIVTGNLGFTAIAWYLLFTRTLGTHRLAAAIGAGLCGFAPAMVSQSNSHLHMTAQWLVPGMVWCVIRIIRAADPEHPDYAAGPRRLLTPTLLLAGLVTLQVFIGEEVLFLTALTLILFTIGYAVAQPARAARIAPRFLAAVLLATALGAVALAYPLWMQFQGPQHVPNGPFSPAFFSADLASFPAFSPLSVAGSAENARLSTGAAEYNAFLGWPLLILTSACVGLLWRKPITWALVFAGAVMAWLSLGPQLVVDGERSQRAGPYALLEGLPVVDGALPMRFAIALVPVIATLLALALHEVLRAGPDRIRIAATVAVAVALVPIAPKPLPVTERAPVPEFITAGLWRDCVAPGGVLVPVPLPTPPDPDPMRWAAATNAAFGVPEGFFIGPYASGGRASMGTYSQPTSHLLKEVARTGQVPGIGVEQRDQARRDLTFWTASCVALAPDAPHHDELRATLEALLGPGRQLGGVWTWRV